MPRHDRLLGRSDDMIIFRGVNVYPGQISDILHDFPELGSEYHIRLSREEGRDTMLLQIERAAGFGSDGDARLASGVARAMHSKVLVSAGVEIVNPGALPRSFSKSRRVTDTREIYNREARP
jgi:phenylacetate-CoA ligase